MPRRTDIVNRQTVVMEYNRSACGISLPAPSPLGKMPTVDPNKPIIGRAAVVFLLILFLALVALFGALATKAHAIKSSDRPGCLPSGAVASCSILFGSTDTSGFINVRARRKEDPASAGQDLAMILFRVPRKEQPSCEVRASSELPAVTLRTTPAGMTLVLRDDTRLPSVMRWFYQCR